MSQKTYIHTQLIHSPTYEILCKLIGIFISEERLSKLVNCINGMRQFCSANFTKKLREN